MHEGILNLLSGLKLLLAEAALRAVLWRMLGLLLVLLLLLAGGVFFLAQYLAAMWIPEGSEWYWQFVGYLAWLVASALALVTGAVSFSVLASAAVAPWLDELATRTERLSGKEAQVSSASWVVQSLHALSNSVRPLLGLLGWGVIALLFIWLPPLATAIWGYAGIRFLNFELIDTTASRHDMNFAARKAWLAERPFYWFGFGGFAMLMLVVPGLNLLVLPAAVVASTQQGAPKTAK